MFSESDGPWFGPGRLLSCVAQSKFLAFLNVNAHKGKSLKPILSLLVRLNRRPAIRRLEKIDAQ